MLLDEQLAHSGQTLFRWRSYIPLVLLGITVYLLRDFDYPFGSRAADRYWELGCLAISLLGLWIRMATLGRVPPGTSGRNTKKQVADYLNTTGMYSMCRNPLYLGNFFIVFGTTFLPRVWWYPIFYILLFALFYERVIMAEERFLRDKYGQPYRDWAAKTPAFWPSLGGRVPAELRFSLRTVIRREFHSLAGIIGVYALLEGLSEYFRAGAFTVDPMWQWMFYVSVGFYVPLLLLDRFTKVLHEDRKDRVPPGAGSGN